MADFTQAAYALLARQHGVASMTDFTQVGMAPWEVADLSRRGALSLVLPGAWKIPAVPESDLQRCAAVCRAHPRLVIAGPAAGRMYGLRRLPGDRRIHAIAPPASNPTIHTWVSPFRTATYDSRDVVDRDDGIRVLRRPRLALDLARFVGDDDLLSIIEQCMLDGRHDDETMLSVAAPWISPRRGWVRRYYDALDRRISGPAAESHLEVLLGDELRARGVRGLVRQHQITAPGHGVIRFDLAIPALRWAVEVDGFPTHREVVGRRADEQRDSAARRCGWTVERVDPHGFGARLATTARHLMASLGEFRRSA